MKDKIYQFIEDYKTFYELQVNPGMEDELKRKRQEISSDDAKDIHNKRVNPNVNVSNTNYSDGKTKSLDRQFINDLLVYLDSHFPKPGVIRVNIKGELRKHLHGDEDELLRVQKKVGDVVGKEYTKFIDNVGKRVSKIAIEP